jgi:hypothetical protein
MGLPACAKGIDFYRNRPFPRWVRAFFAAIVALVIVSLAWNWRFFQAHFETKAALDRMGKGDLPGALQQASAATAHAPEVRDLQSLAKYLQGLVFLDEDKCDKAEECFARCAGLPSTFGVPQLQRQAAVGAAFDRKNYDRFLKIAEDMAREQPSDAIAQAQLASALACQYAVRADPELRRRAEAHLQLAKNIDNDTIQKARYEERIRHRLQTREIINAKEFIKRFPDRWSPSGAPKP